MSTNIVLKKGHTTLDLGSINQFRLSPNRIFCENGELDSYYTNLILSFKEDLYNLLIYRPPTEGEFRRNS